MVPMGMAIALERASYGDRRVANRRRRRRRWPLRLAVLIVVLATLAGIVLGGLLIVTPSPAGAPGRVAAILAAHHAPSDGGNIPAKVAAAVLATEDSRFYSDPAVDFKGTLRAFWGVVTSNPNEGGATIEIQLAKLLYTPGRTDPVALSEQVAIAMKMDHDFSKRRILAMYLDAAYFGDGAYGVTAASERFFGVAPDRLTWAQASLLAGLVQAPSAYDPAHHLSAALERRDHVLQRLVSVGVLSPGQVPIIERAPLDPAIAFSG